MEIDLKKRMAVARENLAAIQEQKEVATQEAARLEVLAIKYKGVVEYLEILVAEQEATASKKKK